MKYRSTWIVLASFDRKHKIAEGELIRAAGEAMTVGTCGLPGTMGRDGVRWLVGDGYVVTVTPEPAGSTFNICRSDSWPSARIGPWDDPTRLMNLANLLKSQHVAVSHVDRNGTRHYQFHFL